jgi:hypothetical protein
MSSRKFGYIATLQTIMLLPAAIFMAALALRTIPTVQHDAQGVVMFYAHRLWTLWVLLVSLPLCVVAAGSVMILSSRKPLHQSLTPILVMTATGCAVLAVVVVHMLAN